VARAPCGLALRRSAEAIGAGEGKRGSARPLPRTPRAPRRSPRAVLRGRAALSGGRDARAENTRGPWPCGARGVRGEGRAGLRGCASARPARRRRTRARARGQRDTRERRDPPRRDRGLRTPRRRCVRCPSATANLGAPRSPVTSTAVDKDPGDTPSSRESPGENGRVRPRAGRASRGLHLSDLAPRREPLIPPPCREDQVDCQDHADCVTTFASPPGPPSCAPLSCAAHAPTGRDRYPARPGRC
jgi:hypothetical protein